MNRSLSIRARTALVFAVTSMVLTAAVLAFVNLASQRSFAGIDPGAGGPVATPLDPDAIVTRGRLSIVAEVATLQWQWSAVGIVVAGLLAGALGWFVSRRMLRPIDRITEATTRISASNLHERIALGGPDDELRRLSRTIDALLERLEGAFESQRRFVAQASHELRTPLAVQRAAIQIGLPDDASAAEVAVTREELLDQNRRTEHLVESLLVLAEAERGLDARREPLDLATIAAEVTSGVADAARLADVTVTCVTDTEPPDRPAAAVTGEPVLVRQLLANLVDNAVEYNAPGGSVRLRVDALGVTVENTGAVVREDEVSALAEPFRRGPDGGSHRHSGLGLSIVAAIARAHGWRLDLRARPEGGLCVRVGVSPG
ncbi:MULTISPECIES: sensor histidine kinase [unclassified Curtobacterium]|uniref:sensor histidine kinase n=1 Tax=unclassified Curtobacterium TaxID=257496 RepID=UPI00382C704B